MSDAPTTGIQIPGNVPRPRRRIAGLIALLTICGVAFAGYMAWVRLEQASTLIAGPVVIVTVIGGAVAVFVAALRTMSASDMLEAIWEAVLLAFEAITAVLRGVWHWFLGLFGLD